MPKFFSFIILVLVLLSSCTSSKSDLEGLWESAYQIQTEPNRGIVDYKKFMKIDGDSLFFRTTGAPKMDFTALDIRTKYRWTKDGIETDEESLKKIFIHQISNDSIVISYDTKNSTKEVFKKPYQPNSKINWNPSGKSYEFQGNSAIVNTKFLENGLYIDYLPEIGEVSVGHWNTFNIKDNLILVLDKLNILALSVDSLANNQVYLSIQDERKFNYTFQEQNLKTPKNLFGDWELITCDTLRKQHSPFTKNYQLATLDFLRINKDSIVIRKGNIESIQKWTIGGANNLIIFPDVEQQKDTLIRDTLSRKERQIRWDIFKIETLSENELVLLTKYELVEFNGFEIRLRYRRKN